MINESTIRNDRGRALAARAALIAIGIWSNLGAGEAPQDHAIVLGTTAPLTGCYQEVVACPGTKLFAALRRGGGIIDVLDAATGDPVAALDRRFMNSLVAFPSRDVVLGADVEGIWRIPLDRASALVRVADAPERGDWQREHAVASADGRVLLVTERQDLFTHPHAARRLRVVEPGEPRLERELPFDERDLTHGEQRVHATLGAATVSGDGRVVAALVDVVRDLDGEDGVESLPGALIVWDAAAGRRRLLQRFDGDADALGGIALTSDGSVVFGNRSQIDLARPDRLERVSPANEQDLHGLMFPLDDATEAFIDLGKIVLWDRVHREVVASTSVRPELFPQAVCATREAGVIVADLTRVRVFDPRTLVERWQPVGHGGEVQRVAFLPNDQLLSLGRGAIVWDIAQRAPIRSGAVSTSFTFAVDPDGARMLVNNDDYRSQVVSLSTLAPVGAPGERTQAAAWPDPGRAVGVWHAEGEVWFSEGVPPHRTGSLSGPDWRGWADVSADGSRAFACNDDSVFLYDLRTRRLAWSQRVEATHAVLTGDGGLLALGVLCEDAALRLIDTSTGEQIGALPIEGGNVLGVDFAFARLRPRIAVAQRSGDIVVSDIGFAAGQARAVEVARFHVPVEPGVVALSADGTRIAAGGADGRIAIVSIAPPSGDPSPTTPP